MNDILQWIMDITSNYLSRCIPNCLVVSSWKVLLHTYTNNFSNSLTIKAHFLQKLVQSTSLFSVSHSSGGQWKSGRFCAATAFRALGKFHRIFKAEQCLEKTLIHCYM